MGDWFRLAPSSDFYEDPHFFQGVLRRLRAIPGLKAEGQDPTKRGFTIFEHLRYLDLKASEGSGSIPDPPIAIIEYVKDHYEEIVGYWRSDQPKVTVLLGWAAQRVFERKIKGALIKAGLAHLTRIGLSHPSQWWHEMGGLTDAKSRLRPLNQKLNFRGPIAKRWKEGTP